MYIHGFLVLSSLKTQSVHVYTYKYHNDIISSVVVNCSFVLEPNNGVVSYNPQGQNQTLVGATVNYTCNSGYTLNGNNMRICQANGTWSGSDPTCNSECLVQGGIV